MKWTCLPCGKTYTTSNWVTRHINTCPKLLAYEKVQQHIDAKRFIAIFGFVFLIVWIVTQSFWLFVLVLSCVFGVQYNAWKVKQWRGRT